MADRTIQYIIKMQDKMSPALKKVRGQVNRTKASVKSFGASVSKLSTIGVGLSATAFVAVTNNMIKAASDAEEVASKFGVVFRDVSDKAGKVAKDLAENYGLSSRASQQLLSDTGDLLSGFGFSGESTLDLSEQVNKLAVDLASFTNIEGGAERASQALTRALLGERESVKSLGIAILETDVKARVKQLESMGKLTNMTMKQKKAYATLTIAQEQSKNAVGDFARTQGEFANQSRIMKARLEDVKIELGKALLPIWLKAVKILKKLAVWIKNNSKAFKVIVKIVVIVTGVIIALISAIKIWIIVQTIIDTLLIANPIGAIIMGIVALIAVISQVIEHYKEWGAAVTLLLGPLGLIINLVQLFRNNWTAIVKAFRSKGILEGLLAIGKTILDAIIFPVQQLLELIGDIPGLEIAASGAASIEQFRKKFLVLEKDINDFEKDQEKKKEDPFKIETIQSLFDPMATAKAKKAGESVVSAGGIKSFNINIQSLTGVNTIETNNIGEAPEKIGKLITQAILKAVADVQPGG